MFIKFRKGVEKPRPKEGDIYTLKGNRYAVLSVNAIKMGEEWVNAITYVCLYHNPHGTIWTRFESEFVNKFTLLSNQKAECSNLIKGEAEILKYGTGTTI